MNIIYGVDNKCDLTDFGGKKYSVSLVISSKVTNMKKTYSDIRLVTMDAAGIRRNRSVNLVDLL